MIKPREDKFFVCFNQLADCILEGTKLLTAFFEVYDEPEKNLELINQVEDRGDQLLSQVIEQISSSFITPFDREDILTLGRDLNHIVDHIQGTMEKVMIYRAGQPQDINILKMAYLSKNSAEEIKLAVNDIKLIRDNREDILASCNRIKAFEYKGRYYYRMGIAQLFDQTENIVEIIKWKEIYEHLKTTLGYCGKVSNLLKGITVKYV